MLMSYWDVFWWGNAPSLLKVTFPQWTSTNSVAQPFAYNAVNQLVLSGQSIRWAREITCAGWIIRP